MTTYWDKVLRIDIETYSGTDLLKCGVYKYVEDPNFEIQLLAYAWDDEPVKVVDLAQGEELPDFMIAALTNAKVLKTAYNANFERTCLAKALGVAMPPEQWRCTAVRAATLGLPRSLAEVGDKLGIKDDYKKMKAGKALVLYFSKPCTPTQRNGGRTRNLPHHDPDRWVLYKKYCVQDVEAERAIDKALEDYPETTEQENELWFLDQKINDSGVLVDRQMVHNILDYYTTHKENLIERAQEISGIDNPNAVGQIKEWLSEQGVEADKLNKDVVKDIIKETDNDEVTELLQIRQELGKTSVGKYEAMDRAACTDDRIRGMLHFYGANRTGRWAGRIVQLQNLPKNKMSLDDLKLARSIVAEGDFELLEMLYDAPMDVFSQLIRTALIPAPGKTYVVADYSAIEARVIAWLAGETWRLDVFASHGKIYEASAAHMFKIPIEQITKDSPERAKGKVAELALGYQGAAGALKAMGAEAMGLTDPQITLLVTAWRRANPAIVQFWSDTEALARDAILTPGQKLIGNQGLEFQMIKDTLFITLPSGRKLAYKNAKIVGGAYKREIRYEGMNQTTGKWEETNTYGGKLVENITQAVARDCLAEAMLRLDKAGYTPAFHVHDEVVIEVPEEESQKAMQEIVQIMSSKEKGLILTADAYITNFYVKD